MKYLWKLKTLLGLIRGMRYFNISFVSLVTIIFYVFKYRIEPWHLTQLASATNYQKFIIEQVNLLNMDLKILDIGCGLGFLARKISFESYIGVDSNRSVVECARKLSGGDNADFVCGDAADDETASNYDANVILALNFLHYFNEVFVVDFIKKLAKKNTQGHIIFDYNVTTDRVTKVFNILNDEGFEMKIYPNEDGRSRVIFFITFGNV